MALEDLKTKKRIEIKLIDPCYNDYKPDYDFPTAEPMGPRLHYGDCKNIFDHITKEAKGLSFDDAIDGLIAGMYNKCIGEITIDIEGRNKLYAPPKEMTVEEIEEALGYKVKIVGEK